MHLAALRLLVLAHSVRHLAHTIWTHHQQQAAVQVLLDHGREPFLRHAQLLRQACRIYHSQGHGMAMVDIIMLLMGQGLDRMGECMAQVELAALPALKLVTRHHACLHLRSGRYERRQLRQSLREYLRPFLHAVAVCITLCCRYELRSQPCKKLHSRPVIVIILYDECLQHFRSACLERLHRKALQHLRAYVCELRLADRSEHILIASEIHSCLAAYSRIHLRQESRRHVRETHSPLIQRRRKPHHVGGYAAAYRQHERIPVRAIVQKPSAYVHHGLHALCLL